MGTLLAIWEGIKLAFGFVGKKISWKGLFIFLALVAFGVGQYAVYAWGKHTQASADQIVIAKKDKTIGELNEQLAGLQGDVKHWKSTADAAQTKFEQLQNGTVKELQAKVTAANAEAATWKKKAQTPKEIIKYVTAKADTQCIVTHGAVQLFNDSATAAPYGASVGVPGGFGILVDAPTPVKLSGLLSAAASNNAEAVRRGHLIEGWQQWYRSTAANWNAVQQALIKGVPPQEALKAFSLGAPPKE